jgi:hypothetical protein
MDTLMVKRKRRRLMISLAAMGFVIAAAIWAYAELTDASPPRPFSLALWTAFVVLCPPSLLTAPLIDVEPGSTDFTIAWLVIGLLNSALYAVIGAAVGRLRWKSDGEPGAPASEASP